MEGHRNENCESFELTRTYELTVCRRLALRYYFKKVKDGVTATNGTAGGFISICELNVSVGPCLNLSYRLLQKKTLCAVIPSTSSIYKTWCLQDISEVNSKGPQLWNSLEDKAAGDLRGCA